MTQVVQLLRLAALIGVVTCFGNLQAATWYVRADGGDRSQCNGKANTPYPGQGSDLDCALKHPFYLFTTGPANNRPVETPKWIIAGGDTVVLQNDEYRIGYKSNDANGYWNFTGCRGGPATCYNPVIPAGTPENPTRIVGEQWASGCAVKARLTGGISLAAVLNLNGAKNVAIECLEISDFAQCGTGALKAPDECVRSGFPRSDYALRGLTTDLETDGLLLRNLDIHGMAQMGIRGRIGGTITADHIRISGIQGGGWDNDDGGGIHSTGTLVIRNSLIEWAGCMEEYPVKSALPYYKCFDQSHGGYGDGLGILAGEGMHIEIDRSVFRNNVQDGVDLLYVHGVEPTVTVTRSEAYANGGQQWKFGPFKQVDFHNNLTIANCRRFAETFSGIPETFNQNVSDYCRAVDGVAVTMTNNTTVNWFNNTTVGYTSTMFDLICTKVIDTFNKNGRGGASALDPAFALDGSRKEFQLSQIPEPIDVNGLRVNNVRQTLGIMGVDTGKQWYWDRGTRTLVQDPSGTPLAPKDQMIIQYSVPGYCQNTKFNYANNIYRGYRRIDTKRAPTVFYMIDLDDKRLFGQSIRRNNLFCGALELPLFPTETYERNCPGNWLAREPFDFDNETTLDALDLRLAPESMARDTGVPLEPVHDDFEGVARYYSSGPDIGAYEVAPIEAGAAPTIQASAANGKVYLRWPTIRSALLYRIQRRAASETEFSGELISVLSAAYIDDHVEADQSYCYRVRPLNAVNEGEWGPEACVATASQAQLPPSFFGSFRVKFPPTKAPASLPNRLKKGAAWLALPLGTLAIAFLWTRRRRVRPHLASVT